MKRPARPLRRTSDVLDIQDWLRANKTYRDYVLFVLGVTTGYRTGDLVALKVRDVKEALRRKEFTVKEGKKFNNPNVRRENRKARTVEIPKRLDMILRAYIADMKDYEYMFQSRKGKNKAIGVQQVSNILKEAGEYFGLYDITAHSMRKTYAYKLYVESGRDALLVKELLGHSSIEETKRYIGVEREDLNKFNYKLNDFIG